MPDLSRTAVAAALTLPVLAGCGGDSERFPPPCPRPVILRDAGDLHRYRGTGRDITDSVLDGRITGISGKCERDGPRIVLATLTIGIDLTRGPAAPSRTADVAYFVAVSDGDQILDKQVYTVRGQFPENTDRLRLNSEQIELRLPVSPQRSAASYRIMTGFQLTPAELQANQSRPGR